MTSFKRVAEIIERNRDLAEFGTIGNGVSEEWIAKAEVALGVALPLSYRWWLKNYGGGEICGDEIYSIYEMDFDTVSGGDIVYMYRVDQREGFFKPSQICICHSDIDGDFFFEVAGRSAGDEYPIMSIATGREYAANFLEFLVERIKICGGVGV